MGIWTDGSAFVIANGYGIARCEEGDQQLYRFSREGSRREDDLPELTLFAVADSTGRRALLRRENCPPQLWECMDKDPQVIPCQAPELHDAVATANDQLLIAASDPGATSQDPIVLQKASLESDRLGLGNIIELPGSQKLTWKSGLWKEGKEKWLPETTPSTMLGLGGPAQRGRVRLCANRYGVAISSTHTGTVALLDATSLAPLWCARVPTPHEQFDLFVLPVAHGVLITLVAERRNTEFVLVDRELRVRAHRHKIGKDLASGSEFSGVAWSDEAVLIHQHLSRDEIRLLSLPALDVSRSGPFDKMESCVVDSATAPDGKTHILAFAPSQHKRPVAWKLMRCTVSENTMSSEDLPMPELRPPRPIPEGSPLVPRRFVGAPALGVVADNSTPWTVPSGAETKVRLKVSNSGGPLRGTYVEIAGPAVASHLVTAIDVVSSGTEPQTSTFRVHGTSLRADLPGLTLGPAADVEPKRRIEGDIPTFDLMLRIRGDRSGQGLLTVRVGPLNQSGTTGSGLQGRMFTVG